VFITSASLGLINPVSAVVYLFVLPAVGISRPFYDLSMERAGYVSSNLLPRA
jgi:hypothetical protein